MSTSLESTESALPRAVRSEGARHARIKPSWFAPLFPEAKRSGLAGWQIGGLYAISFLGLSALALLRQSGIPATNSVWAEDGVIFYEQSRLHSFAHTLTTPYNGYLQLGPRLFVQLTHLAPMVDAAAVMATTGACVLALICCYVFHASRGVLAPLWSRIVLVAAMILLPLATGEILDNNVNIGWWLFFAAFWALIARPRTTTDSVLAGLVCLLAIGTEPLVALLFPLAVARVLVARTDLRQEAPIIGLILGLVYQGIGLVKTSGSSSTFAMATTHGALGTLGVRVGWGWLTGATLSNHLIASSHPRVWQATGYLVLACVVAVAILLRHRATIFFVVTSVGLAVITFVVPVVIRGAGPTMLGHPLLVGSRYSATPVLLVCSAVLVEVVRLTQVLQRRAVHYVPVLVCLVLFVPVWILDFREVNLRSAGPSWGEQVSLATHSCASGRRSATLQVSPPGWAVTLPCRDISS